MAKHILVIQGHPDPNRSHLGHALADAYARAAVEGGHEVRRIEVAQLEFPLLRSAQDFESGTPPPPIRRAQEDVEWAGHLIIFFPLWHGMMPALLKGFLEQVLRPGFAFRVDERGRTQKFLKGRSARLVVTMGMPAFVYRWYYRAHGTRSLKRSILGFCGIGPVREDLFGMVEGGSAARRASWLGRMRELGHAGR